MNLFQRLRQAICTHDWDQWHYVIAKRINLTRLENPRDGFGSPSVS
jgi:hypothetical protein